MPVTFDSSSSDYGNCVAIVLVNGTACKPNAHLNSDQSL